MGPSADSLDGGPGNDKLYGGAGDDGLLGGAGNDLLEGSSGNDVLNADLGADIMKGGAGWDLVYYGSRTKPVILDLDGAKGDDGEKGEKDTIAADVEELIGGAGKDTLTGNAKANGIYGQAGNDVIRGGAGDDTLVGQGGHDKIYGDAGDDYLVGENHTTIPNPDNPSPGSNAAKDRLDGGTNTVDAGDNCIVLRAGKTINCEQFGD